LLPGAIGYANLWPCDGAHAYGVAYIVHRTRTASDGTQVLGGLARLDEFEGVAQRSYERVLVNLELQDGSTVEGTVYLVCPGARAEDPELLRPTRSYLAHLLSGESLLPAFQVDALRQTPLTWMPDPAANVSMEQALRVSEPSSKPFGEQNPHSSASPPAALSNGGSSSSAQPLSPPTGNGVRLSLRGSGSGAGSAALAALRSKLLSPPKSAAVPASAVARSDADGVHLVAPVPGAISRADLYSPALAETKQ